MLRAPSVQFLLAAKSAVGERLHADGECVRVGTPHFAIVARCAQAVRSGATIRGTRSSLTHKPTAAPTAAVAR